MNDVTPPPPTAAPVTVEVWCELQSTACRAALPDLRALRDRHGDRLDLRLRHFPRTANPHAFAAAQAAEEAFAQGAGWPYVEAVLARVADLTARGQSVLLDIARELGLDAEEFDTALIDGRHILIVDADEAEGKAIGVTTAPAYVVGAELIGPGPDQAARVEAAIGRSS